MHRSRALFRPLGSFTRHQFSADYTIGMLGFDLPRDSSTLAQRRDRCFPGEVHDFPDVRTGPPLQGDPV